MFVGVPLIGGGAVIGVLVLQRRERAVRDRRGHARDRARRAGHARDRAPPRRRGPLGAAARPRACRRRRARPRRVGADHDRARRGPPIDLDRAFARLRDDLGARDASGSATQRSPRSAPRSIGSRSRCAIAAARAARRRRRQPSWTARGRQGLRARPYRLGTDRARRRTTSPRSRSCACCSAMPRSLRPGAIWIADRIGAFVAIAAVARGASALVASDAVAPAAIAIARAARMPVVSDVPGLFGWARPGDLLAVDGDTGACSCIRRRPTSRSCAALANPASARASATSPGSCSPSRRDPGTSRACAAVLAPSDRTPLLAVVVRIRSGDPLLVVGPDPLVVLAVVGAADPRP